MTNVPTWPQRWPVPVHDSVVGLGGVEIDDRAVVGYRSRRPPAMSGGSQPIRGVPGRIDAATAETLASAGTADVVDRPEAGAAVSNNTTAGHTEASAASGRTEARAACHGGTTWLWDVDRRGGDGTGRADARVTVADRDRLA